VSLSQTETVLSYIGANVRRLRVERGWTQVELAKAAGLKERYVQILETGAANPTVKVLIDVAAALGVAPTDLFAEAKLEPRPAGNPRI
jgi:transcriptional regulator with XRE-family HTH domain